MGIAPNRKSVVERVSAEDPARFRAAHREGDPRRYDWIKAVAWALHQEDARWGLNGKRGNPDDLSMDVVTFRVGPTDRHVEAFDICGACGGGNPSVVWNDITDYQTIGQPGTAVYVKPEPVGPVVPDPTPEPEPPPSAPVLTPVLEAIAALGGALADIHARLTALEATSAAAAHEAGEAARRASEIKTQIANLPAPAVTFPIYRGRLPLVGTVTLTPEAP